LVSVMGVVFTDFMQITSTKEQQITLFGIVTYPSSHHVTCITHQLYLKSCQFVKSNERFCVKIADVELLKRGVE
jgi:hypothetical protein